MFELLTQMNADINRLLAGALKVAVRKPAELRFLREFLKHAAGAQALREKHEAAGLHVPPFLIASVTSNCNLLCAGCYSRANQVCPGNAAGEPLPAERWGRLFREAAELGVTFILLAGGEPMLRQDVLDAAAARPEMLFPVFTNGTLMDEAAYRRFDAHRNLLPVLSLEGGREETDARRGKGVYDAVMGAMDGLKRRSILFGVSVTVTKENAGDVTDMDFARELKRLGCSLMFYVEYVPSDNASGELAPSDAERALVKERAEAIRKALNLLVISFPGDEADYGGCLAAGRGFVHVATDGSVEPCPFSPYSDTDIRDRPLAEALRSRFLRRMQDEGLLSGEHAGGCLLFERRLQVERLLADCGDGTV
jgi:MoaA/NifB/PqqE/SkfB family radical SAM enzyme